MNTNYDRRFLGAAVKTFAAYRTHHNGTYSCTQQQ
jgi:hypothetical protein